MSGLIALGVYAMLVIISLALGVYLLSTNPPKDESSFLGLGEEKLSDDELGDLDA